MNTSRHLALSLVLSVFSGIAYASTEIQSIKTIVDSGNEDLNIVLAMQRCGALYLYSSIKLEQSGFAKKSTENKNIATIFSINAYKFDDAIGQQRGLEPKKLTKKIADNILDSETITQMAIMYGEEGKRNYSKTGNHFTGLIAQDIDTCKSMLPQLLNVK